MTIAFADIGSLRVPTVAVEFDSTNAQQGPSVQPYAGLLIAQRTSSGTKAELDPFLATSADAVRQAAGAGSVAHRMAIRIFQNNATVPWTVVLLDDAGGATAKTTTLTITGTQSEGGTAYLYVHGERLEVGVALGDSNSDVATAIAAAVNARTDLAFTAAPVSNVVTLTAKNAGTAGNELDVRLNYLEGENLPAGLAIAIADGATGATDPLVTQVWPVLATDVQFTDWAVGLNTTAAIAAVVAELEARAKPLSARLGRAYFSVNDTVANLVTFGNGQNSAFAHVLGHDGGLSPTFEWSAAMAARAANALQIDPARPLKTLSLVGIVPPPAVDRFDASERELLLADGISTFTVSAGGVVRLERVISTWQTNEAGAPSTAFLEINSAAILDFVRYDVSVQTLLRYPRHKVTDDSPKGPPPGQPIVTPQTYALFVLGLARGWVELGLIENLDQFKRDLLVERNAADPTRLDVSISPDLVNPLLIVAMKAAFLL